MKLLKFYKKQKLFRITLNKLDYESAIVFDKKLSGVENCKALLIDIVAAKGGVTQCEDFLSLIEQFKQNNKNTPVYTFGNEAVFGPSLLLLLAGNKCFVDPNTLMGLYDFQFQRNFYKKFLEEKKCEIKFITAGNHKVRLNPFKDIKEEDIQWAKNLLKKDKKIFIEKVALLRGDKLKISKEDLEKNLNSQFLSTDQAFEIGLVDGFDNLDTFRQENYKNFKIKDASISTLEIIKSFNKLKSMEILSPELSLPELYNEAEMKFMSYIFENTLKNEYYI